MWEHLLIATGAVTAFYQAVKIILDAYKYFVQNEKTVKRHVKEGMDTLGINSSDSSKGARRLRGKAGNKKRVKKLDEGGEELESKLPGSNAS